jgi:hypothetical protein
MFRTSNIVKRTINFIPYKFNSNRLFHAPINPVNSLLDQCIMLEKNRLSDLEKELERLNQNPLIHDRLNKLNSHYT